MIVLDEQLLGYGLQANLSRWYRGTVTDITQLRPGTVIEDDAIPLLLRAVRQPTFVTINVEDFWCRLPADPRSASHAFRLGMLAPMRSPSFCVDCSQRHHSRREACGLAKSLA